MCVVSMVHDWYEPKFPNIWDGHRVSDIQKLIEEFKRAREAAELVDKLTGQPDCVDPDKAKLEARVAELEKQIAELKKPKRRKRKLTNKPTK